MPDSAPPILVDLHENVLHLRFNRPASLNAISADLADALRNALLDAQDRPCIRVVVLTGAGRAFMAGGDLAQLGAAPEAAVEALIPPSHDALMLLRTLGVPVVAGVQGAVAGAGFSLMMQADLTVAAHDARFSFAYARAGTSPDLGGSWSLPRIVGLRRALEIAMLGDSFGAERALEIGLVNRVVPAAELEAETLKMARTLAEGPPIALAQIKRLITTALDHDLKTHLDLEYESFKRCAKTKDFSEAVDAFFSKRKPRFEGR